MVFTDQNQFEPLHTLVSRSDKDASSHPNTIALKALALFLHGLDGKVSRFVAELWA